MLNNFKKTFRHSAIYSFGNLSIKAIGLVLLPLYTSHLTTGDYGALTLLEITSTIIVAVFSFKLSTSMMRWCSVEKDELKRKQIVFTTFSFSVLLLLLINGAFFPFHERLSVLFFNENDFAVYFLILIASASFEILNYYPLELIRLQEKSYLYVIVTSVRLTIILSLNIYFIAFLHMGIKGVLLSQLIGHAGVFLLTFPFLLKNIHFSFNYSVLKPMLGYGFPLVFSAISMMLLTMSDRYLIKYFLDYTEVGIYSLGYKIASVINMFIIQSFQMGFLPIAYKIFDKPEANRFFSKTLTYYTFVMVIVGTVIAIFSKEIIVAFARNSDFYSAYTVVPFIVFAFTLRGIQYMFSLGLHYVKKTRYNALIVTSVALLNIGLNVLFIPKWGIRGAAVATLISWIIMTIVFYLISSKQYFVNYEFKKIGLLLLLFVGLNILSFLIKDYSLALRIIMKLIMILSIPFILIPFNFYEPIEIERLKDAWKNRKNLFRNKK